MNRTLSRAQSVLHWVLLIILTLTQDALADLLVSSFRTHEVLRYDDGGNFVEAFVSSRSGGLRFPSGLVIGTDGHLYVAATFPGKVLRYNGQTGDFLGTFVPAGSGLINVAEGLAFHSTGDLLVTSWTQTQLPDFVLRYDGSTGAPLGTFTHGGDLNTPTGIVYGPDGNLYVAHSFGGAIFKYDGQTGAFITSFGDKELWRPKGLAFGADGHIYVAETQDGQVLRYDSESGIFKGVFAAGPELLEPYGLAFGPGGDLFVSDSEQDRILRYDGTTGAFEGVFASGGGLGEPTFLLFANIPEPSNSLVIALIGLFALRRRSRWCREDQVSARDENSSPLPRCVPAYYPDATAVGVHDQASKSAPPGSIRAHGGSGVVRCNCIDYYVSTELVLSRAFLCGGAYAPGFATFPRFYAGRAVSRHRHHHGPDRHPDTGPQQRSAERERRQMQEQPAAVDRSDAQLRCGKQG